MHVKAASLTTLLLTVVATSPVRLLCSLTLHTHLTAPSKLY
nr:MAG TPA: hypothetical protein [Caudoviricetes sp.]